MKIKIGDAEYIVEKLPNGKWTLPEAYENGDNECRCGALNIDGNRVVPYNENDTYDVRHYQSEDCFQNLKPKESQFLIKPQPDGRYPSQTFCDSQVAEKLDKQSGISKSSKLEPHHKTTTAGWGNGETLTQTNKSYGGDTGGCSKILHKCNYEQEDYDIYNYQPKVSKSERNAGCDGEPQQYSHDGRETPIENPYQRNKSMAINNHPTLKPIALNEKILKLFKTPNDDKIVYPFAGSGSEIIGGIKAGFKNWVGCEINPDYVEIAKARIDYWTKQQKQISIFDIERE